MSNTVPQQRTYLWLQPLPVRPGRPLATMFHLFSPYRSTKEMRIASSCNHKQSVMITLTIALVLPTNLCTIGAPLRIKCLWRATNCVFCLIVPSIVGYLRTSAVHGRRVWASCVIFAQVGACKAIQVCHKRCDYFSFIARAGSLLLAVTRVIGFPLSQRLELPLKACAHTNTTILPTYPAIIRSPNPQTHKKLVQMCCEAGLGLIWPLNEKDVFSDWIPYVPRRLQRLLGVLGPALTLLHARNGRITL